MAVIKNERDVLLQATSPRLLSNPLNYLTIIATTNTITTNSGVLTPSTVTIKATLNGSLRGTISWVLSPSVGYTPVTDGIAINSTAISSGSSVTITASITYNGNVYSSTTTVTRKETVSLSSSGSLSGEGGGTITALPYSSTTGGPPANATANFFTTSTSNPTGGSNGDAHYNSSTNVMWFKVSGTWQQGGTINASSITTGTLAAARIAANSITADKLNVSTLDAITANLGTVTAGSITGTAGIDITGSAKFNGSITSSGETNTAVFNDTGATRNGLMAYAGNSNGYAISGQGGGLGGGVWGVSSTLGKSGVNAVGLGSATALNVNGTMTTNNTTLVSNLNADMVDGLHASKFVRTDTNSTVTGNIDVTGTVQTNVLRIDQTPSTGAAAATFSFVKPGSASTNSWVTINFNGTNWYVPVWPA